MAALARLLRRWRLGVLALPLLLIVSAEALAGPQQATGSIGDFVWVDLAPGTDNVQDSSDFPLEDVEIELWRDENASGDLDLNDTFLQSTESDADGEYLFDQLAEDDYIVAVPAENFLSGGPLDEMAPVTALVGNDPALDSNGLTEIDGSAYAAVSLSQGQNDATIDFGFRIGEGATGNEEGDPGGHISGSVNWDLDEDGFRGNEPGLNTVQIRLWRDADEDGRISAQDSVISTTQSSTLLGRIHGVFGFSRLPAGFYLVELAPDNFLAGGPLEDYLPFHSAPLSDPNCSAQRPSLFAIELVPVSIPELPDQMVSNDCVTFGAVRIDSSSLAGPLQVGNLVFSDFNGNGLFEPLAGDFGIDHVSLSLFEDTDGSGDLTLVDNLVSSTVTALQGRYVFKGLAAGDYLLHAEATNFDAGALLEGTASSAGNELMGFPPDPDDDQDDDDNGRMDPMGGVTTLAFTLDTGAEPGPEIDGTGTNHNGTIDLGFALQESPTAGLIDRVEAIDLGYATEIRWTTLAEPGIAGFYLWRQSGRSAEHERVNEHPIAAKGDTRSGAAYAIVDRIEPGSYRYRLEILLVDGRSTWSRPLLLSHPAMPSPAFLPMLMLRIADSD